jgi:superfamily II DNA helicase RecQ
MTLTATATPAVIRDISEILKLKNPLHVCTGFNRDNLYLDVKPKTRDPLSDIKSVLNPKSQGSCIIYVPTRKETESLSELLNKNGYPNLYYHAGLSDDARNEAHTEFIYDKIKIIVATVSFGMGIDKPDIRVVINYGSPSNIETYYQEIGRAGRDGLPSECYVFYSSGDFNTNRYFINEITDPNYKKIQSRLLIKMEKYLSDNQTCRKKTIRQYFGEKIPDEYRCENCDNCCHGTRNVFRDFTSESRLLLGLLGDLSISYGITMLINILRGSNAKKITPKLKALKFYGKGTMHSESWWKAFAQILIDHAYIHPSQGKYGQTLSLSQKAITFLYNQSDRLRLPESKELAQIEIPNLTLYQDLIKTRMDISTKTEKPPYLIASDPVLLELARKPPKSQDEFSNIDGVSKDFKYIDDFLSVLTEVKSNTTTRINNNSRNGSAQTSYDLYQQGSSLTDIAKERNLTVQTVENHLAESYQDHPDMDCSRLGFSDKKYQTIQKAIHDPPINGDTTLLKPIKEQVSRDISYLQIKLAIIKMNRESEPTKSVCLL